MMGIGNNWLLAVFIAAICMTVPASSIVSATIGETVVLSGSAGGYDEMYLFLTGPNLPPGGVRMDSIPSSVVSGDPATFTRTVVDGGRWEYSWDTRYAGGMLDAGTYLVWAAPVPLGRYDLISSGASFATISVTLTKPDLTAVIATDPTGSIHVTSDPSGAMVTVNTMPYGTTPLVIEYLPGGNIDVTVSKAGYAVFEAEVVIRTGTMAVLDVTLSPEKTPTATPVGTESIPVSRTAPSVPPSSPAPSCWTIAGIALAVSVTGILRTLKGK
ncbi:PEGA domain-containing protein [Methanovulcanius yangii]|uniref:PEGA domain-containing protein n=1 Tax=Methanovulcanius yangii TaxID=1789227 RepID=UPI0029CA8CB0|nr:PEGA domain-containing protein [Methanovulcanius yangii]